MGAESSLPSSHMTPPLPPTLSHPNWGLVFIFELKKKKRLELKSEGGTCDKGQVEERSRTS